MTEETKAKISAAQVARFLAKVENPPDQPESKQCSTCHEWKSLAAYYQKKYYRPKSDVTVFYPEQPCKPCRAKHDKLRRDRLKAEGKLEKKKYVSNARGRRRHRERLTARRRAEGRKPRVFKKPRPREGTYDHRLPSGPIKLTLERELETRSITEISEATGVSQRRLHGILHGEFPKTSLKNVDKILHGLGMPEEFHILYPDTSFGWHYVKGKA